MLQDSHQDSYQNLSDTMDIAKVEAKTYVKELMTDLYQEMTSHQINYDQILSYDYKTLECEAQDKRRARESLKASEDNKRVSHSYNGSDNGSGSDNGEGDGKGDDYGDNGFNNNNGDGKNAYNSNHRSHQSDNEINEGIASRVDKGKNRESMSPGRDEDAGRAD
ncbi:hypothetical protein C8R42DRAFT_644515 [Lentinula raphanica]|nr:hypothetical protein C8R42DRAFT_644515 [Lentinula raphanica]KAJ3816972.1 hypothetical protein F5880DRAFT_1512171 [Lentinula raphanica]